MENSDTMGTLVWAQVWIVGWIIEGEHWTSPTA
ncbi:UNVERIFIED_CONTAM: hypothetical protein ABIC26_003359 [Paenibacillus sp. PvR008]